jgi:hypothetical protein
MFENMIGEVRRVEPGHHPGETRRPNTITNQEMVEQPF